MAIYAYTGLVGSGKSYCLIEELIRRFRVGMPQVYSDFVSLRCPHAVYLDAENPEGLVSAERGVVALDEAQVIFNAQFWQSVDPLMMSAFQQSRKNGIDVLLTVQDLDRLTKFLRELVAVEIRCRRIGNVVFQLHYPAGMAKVKPFRKTWKVLSPKVFAQYDTLEVIGRKVGLGLARSDYLDLARQRRSRGRAKDDKAWRPNYGHAYFTDLHDGARRLVRRPWASKAAESFKAFHGRYPRVGGEGADAVAKCELRAWAWRCDWLKFWGLQPGDVPADCTPLSPWLPGAGPFDRPADFEVIEMPGRSKPNRAVRAG